MPDPTTVWPRVKAQLDELTGVLGGSPVEVLDRPGAGDVADDPLNDVAVAPAQ